MKRHVVVVVLLLAGVVGLAGQQDTPRFRAGVELARLDIEVTDAQGRPIEDLRPEEVEIIEDGQRHPVVFFQHVHELAGSYEEAARRTIGGDVSTNQGAPNGRLYVLVFDQAHITAGNEQRARLAAEQFVRARIRPGDRVALYGLPGPGPQVGFTSDIDRVIAELENISGNRELVSLGVIGEMRTFEAYEIVRGNRDVRQRVTARMAEALGRRAAITEFEVEEDARSMVNRADFRARQFLESLAELLRGLRRVEGRKEIVLLSEGFYDDNLGRELEQVAAAAAQSYGIVYGIDLNRRESSIRDFASLGAQRFSAIQSRVSPLGTLAAETDGQLFINASTRLDTVFERIAGASGDYYLVGFEPARAGLEDRNQYRRVEVRVSRRGARVSTRTGYVVGDGPTAADRRQAIDAALTAPFTSRGLRVEYTTYVLRGEMPGSSRVVLSLEAELPTAAARQPEPAAVVFVVRDARDGRVAASGTDVMSLPLGTTPGSTTGRASYRVQFPIAPGDYLMRAVVREPGGQIGSADRRFHVRPMSGPGVSVGDLILGGQSEQFPVRATTFTDDGLRGVLELYGTPPELEEVDVGLRLTAVGATDAVRSIRADLLDIVQTEGGASRTAQIELPLEGVAPGRYVAQVDVTRGGDPIGQFRRELEVIVGTSLPREADPVTTVDGSEILRGQLAARYLMALEGATEDVTLTAALERAGRDDWLEVNALLGPPGPAASLVHHALVGLARFADGDHAGATSALESAFETDTDAPRRALTSFFLGWSYAYLGDDRQAVSAWRRAVFLDGALVPAYLALAEAYDRLSQPALAVQVLQTGLTELPDSPELRDRLDRLMR